MTFPFGRGTLLGAVCGSVAWCTFEEDDPENGFWKCILLCALGRESEKTRRRAAQRDATAKMAAGQVSDEKGEGGRVMHCL